MVYLASYIVSPVSTNKQASKSSLIFSAFCSVHRRDILLLILKGELGHSQEAREKGGLEEELEGFTTCQSYQLPLLKAQESHAKVQNDSQLRHGFSSLLYPGHLGALWGDTAAESSAENSAHLRAIRHKSTQHKSTLFAL